MIRCMDYNDIYWKQIHRNPSDIFPAALAGCERMKSDGKELIVGLRPRHEFEMRFCEAAFPGNSRTWLAPRHFDRLRLTLRRRTAPFISRGSRFNTRLAISASRHATLGAVTAGKAHHDEKHSRSHGNAEWSTRSAHGGKRLHRARTRDRWKEGLTHVSSRVEVEHLTDGLGDSWPYHTVRHEGFPHRGATHTPISAVLDIVKSKRLETGSSEQNSNTLAGSRL